MRVYKYRGGEFERDLESLSENYFWAPTRTSLNDPCEGFFEDQNVNSELDTIFKVFARGDSGTANALENVKIVLKELLGFVDKSGIYSLSQTPLDELLWAHYACNHTGFCVEYDLDKLMEYEKNDYRYLAVKYEDSPQKISISDIDTNEQNKILLKMLGTKSKAWGYEKEIRVITSISGKHNYDYRAVKSIYFGLRMSDEEKNDLMEKLKGRGIKYNQVVLKSKSYDFSFVTFNDPYENANKYKYSVAPIADYAITPEYVNEKYKPFIKYLTKAAEIVRREPDCNEVEMVEFSDSKGDLKSPVIYVQYKRKENRYVNHYLSIKEIEEQYKKLTDIDEFSN
ncbi:DUF2971 domain-containing protein [Pseudoalteromonas sp. SWYJ118]|uniref:DUF2971 domain-containing protein n=2 Tax=unclassified Pseudoalteromonas TaxID=194690 RepID=UPI0018CE1A1B|nr:DUF2971 domain-containing protein [Pseudoalteromonas sp. SWYJ118]